MRIVLLTIVYDGSVNKVYNAHPQLEQKSYAEQKYVVDREISTWTSGWEPVLAQKGIEVLSIPINVRQMQFKWADENGFNSRNIHDIAYEQIRRFSPDIIWYDYFDVPLLKKLKENIPSLKLVLGWTGSSIVDYSILRETDIVLSCAPEAVASLNKVGIKAVHLHHAFNTLLLKPLEDKHIINNFIFIGQIFRGTGMHMKRAELLKQLSESVNLTIFSPSYNYGFNKILLSAFKKTAYAILSPVIDTKWFIGKAQENAYLKEIIRSNNSPLLPYDPALKKRMKPPVYGTEMYDVLFNSLVVLNIHADSSPEYASNMRLFETSGAGTCLLSDWKKNINELYTEGSEIVTYKSNEECLEKARWLIANPGKSREIGIAARDKTLKCHTYNNRVDDLLQIINKNL